MVVLSRGEPHLLHAVRSVLAQAGDAVVEVVVSHSGEDGGLRPLREHEPGVRIDASPARRLPGAARNAGIAVTSGSAVAFLAADCLARPGWVDGRVRRHRAGAAVVASAMASPATPPAALASHLLQHSTRMVHVRASRNLRFGLSYARDVLERYGPFPEDLPGEEDVALNARLLDAGVAIDLAPDVVTEHRYPQTPGALLRDQHRRGRRRQAVRGTRRPRAILIGRALADGPAGLRRALAPASPVPARRLALATPLTFAGAVATAAGIASAPSVRGDDA